MKRIYLITDTHFNHHKLIDLGDRTGADIRNFLDRLNSLQLKNDLLIHLGDVSLGNDEFWHQTITYKNNTNVLVLGNHDNHSIFWYLDKGWNFVCNRFELVMFGYKIIFTHEPLRNVKEGYVNICGHMHYPTLHITNKLSLVPLTIYRLDTLIEEYKKARLK